MSVIDGFLEDYTKKIDFYREIARICAQICETNMEQMGIRAIVTSRAKKVERLRDKIEKRNFQKQYDSIKEIDEDIVDLSGVRIALYFPGDLNKVQQFIESNFKVKECKIFPEYLQNEEDSKIEYKKRFSGYWATHYRVYLKSRDLSREDQKYSGTLIEIQIASALMHAWAEVEHDLVYKPFSGDLSYEEYQILDELNGLVLAGEIALERLQKAVKNRVSQEGKEFNNHYELAMFLYNKLGSTTVDSQKEIVLGRVDLLFNCLKSSRFNKPERLKDLLVFIDPNTKNRSIVDQLIDKIRELNPALYENYLNVKQSEELKYQIETLQMNRENGNRQGEANTLANIGYIYSSKENYDEAINYFTQAVKINNEIGGIQGEGNQLLNLGSTFRLKGDLDKAFEYCNQAIELHRQIGYKQGQANTLGMIGNIFSDKGNFIEAFKYYEEALGIYIETNYKMGEAIQLNNLGSLFVKQKDIVQALEYYNKAVAVCTECDYKQCEGDTLFNIGNIYLEEGDLEKAFIYFEKALAIQDAADSQKSKVGILISLGKAYVAKGDVDEALKHFNKALIISNNIEFKNGEEEALECIDTLQIK